ncbi:MAG: PGF-CTERM sorting domain-containing protein [Candidatus Pacebacteria bacterium]|nr:PGF-CTERM sorting domain-containing protein [Candidatus Paceibacterota bacterium]
MILTITTATATDVTAEENANITKINSTETSTAESDEPGFEAIFAIAGLLAVAFLVRRD